MWLVTEDMSDIAGLTVCVVSFFLMHLASNCCGATTQISHPGTDMSLDFLKAY